MNPLIPNDPDPNVNALIVAVNSIEQELGLNPQGVYASIRTRLDILEARINNPLVPAPNVNNPFYIDGTGVSIRTGFGNPQITLPPAVPGSLFLREDGYNIQGLYAFRPDGLWHQIPTDPFIAAGDLSGTNYTQTVIGIQGRPVHTTAPIIDAAGDGYVLTWGVDGYWGPQIGFFAHGDLSGTKLNQTVVGINGHPVAATTPTTGNTLSWSGTTWAPNSLNLAGGPAFVTGQLPPANIGTITLTGDVTGAAASGSIPSTVVKINGTSVPATPITNQVLVASSGTTALWQLIIDNQISNSAGILGTKIAPNFGSQAVSTTGTLASGSATVTGNATISGTTTSNSIAWSTTPNFGVPAAVVFPTDLSYTVPSGQYKSLMLLVTSSVSLTSTHKLILPLVTGSAWIIQNNTTGGASFTVIGLTGSGVTIANGAGALVWTDGTNFYSA